jgi:RNA polymerase sigma factor (sigma-70 family)
MIYTEDIDLINNIKNKNDSLALKELEARHSGICHQMIKRYYHNMVNSGIDPEDIASDKLMVIYRSVLNYNPEKNVKFSTWLGNQMRYHCLNCLNKKGPLLAMEGDAIKNIVEQNQKKNNYSESLIKEKSDFIFSLLERTKDERILKIFKLRYFNDSKHMAWNKIGKTLGISTQTAINLHNKGKRFIKNKLTSLNNSDII